MFSSTTYAAIDKTGDALFVSDGFRVEKFTLSTGAFVGAIGVTSATSGTCPAAGVAGSWCTGGTFTNSANDGGFQTVFGIVAHSEAGYLYIVDRGNHRVLKHNLSSGSFVGGIGGLSASTGTCPSSGAASSWCTGGTFASGNTDGKFNTPWGISIDTVNYNLYVNDYANNRLVKIR
jgi:hypothetical protein